MVGNIIAVTLALLQYNEWVKSFSFNLHIPYWGAKGSRDSGPFHIKLKTHAKEEEMPEDEQRESRLPGYTAEDDPVLGRPKSQKGKAPRRQAIPSRIPKEISSPMSQP